MLNCIFYKSFRHRITAIFSHFREPARHTADRSRCFVGAGYQSKYCLRESRSVGATGLIHWFILEYRKRQEMNFCFDTLNIFVYNCSAYFRKFWKSIIQIYSDTLFSSFVCKVKFLRLSTLSHLLFTWSASHNWVRHKNDKPTTQMPRVGGGLRRYEGNSLPVTKPPTHRNKWQTVKAFVTDQPHRLRRLASLQFSRCIREISKNTLRGKRFWYNL